MNVSLDRLEEEDDVGSHECQHTEEITGRDAVQIQRANHHLSVLQDREEGEDEIAILLSQPVPIDSQAIRHRSPQLLAARRQMPR